MTEGQIRKTYLDFQENNPIRHCSLEAQLLEFGKICATEATKELQKELDYAKSNCLFSNCDRVARLKSQIVDLEKENARFKIKAREIIRAICEGYASTKVSEREMIERVQKAEAFLKE